RAVADRAVATEADRAPAGAAAARAGALQAVAPAALHLADLVADQAAIDVAILEARREVARAGDRGERTALLRVERAEDAGGARGVHRLLAGELRIAVV